MISIVITSFKEPEVKKAIDSFLNQKIDEKYELIVVAPDEETRNIVKEYQKSKEFSKTIRLFKDPGRGKSFALNLLLPEIKGEIIILSDGDVFVSRNSVNQIIEPFKNSEVGCVTGRPVSIESRKTIFGYWSHLLVDGMHMFRSRRARKKEFIECSGYLWAFRNNVIKRFPLDLAEDTVVPLLFREKGYKIKYVPEAEVFVKYPTNLSDFIEQKKRTAKGHESLVKYINIKKIPRMKTFWAEVSGAFFVLLYPKTIKEVLWTIFLFPTRLYIWMLTFYHTIVKRQHYQDNWKRVKTAR